MTSAFRRHIQRSNFFGQQFAIAVADLITDSLILLSKRLRPYLYLSIQCGKLLPVTASYPAVLKFLCHLRVHNSLMFMCLAVRSKNSTFVPALAVPP